MLLPLMWSVTTDSKEFRVQSLGLADVSPQLNENGSRTFTVRLPLRHNRPGASIECLLRQWMVSRRRGEVVADVLFITDRPY